MLIFLTGGVRSGKSTYAEALVERLLEKEAVYIATSKKTDAEMEERIKAHKLARKEGRVPWRTLEQQQGMSTLFPSLKETDVVLLDCATNWLANELFTPPSYNWPSNWEWIVANMMDEVKALHEKVRHLIVVSNEIFQGGYEEGVTENYMKALGCFHGEIVKRADVAGEIVGGIPRLKKGQIHL
ncbi:bifunctional adenosylcobinamide kinase/adenosylcobinamide-phosphate guanylyltransferase [Priestia endophytica]|uniref:bifunctional adenosylcobinamide kinase/adenosylcobinamide-phosphate guanylyltransferase n=1 Tax=Priestia endophytica TaxID=135735 RepID=UPI002E22840F|nr:bifunctional adenosylcobinamide kinase/adenosylcobinamide-phosphate guanylyltransferase [Priestia endophytica]MED4069968.1 bifunctional adenosylcobinamide kinase/adenosylcobinamide-phosphate guanylyltransferase [Priestia endophytica]